MFGQQCATQGCMNVARGESRYCSNCKEWYGLFNSEDDK